MCCVTPSTTCPSLGFLSIREGFGPDDFWGLLPPKVYNSIPTMCHHHEEPKATKKTGTYKAGGCCGSGEGRACRHLKATNGCGGRRTEEGFREEVVPELTSRTSKG